MREIKKVCVYCSSSKQIDKAYHQGAFQLGQILAKNGVTIVYGGGAVGSMGHLAEGALSENGEIIGIIPEFMYELEWGHPKISQLQVVEDMHIRKQKMIEGSDAVIALPGGSGTFEELFEALTLKRLGFYQNPIVLLNTKNYFDPCIKMLEKTVEEQFMDQRHGLMWSVAKSPDEVLSTIQSAPVWFENARSFAAI